MVKLTDNEAREALDRVYAEESSAIDEGLARIQAESLPNED